MEDNLKNFIQSVNLVSFSQFTIDFCEEIMDKLEYSTNSIDVTMDALHYELTNILEIMREDTKDYTFFKDLRSIIGD